MKTLLNISTFVSYVIVLSMLYDTKSCAQESLSAEVGPKWVDLRVKLDSPDEFTPEELATPTVGKITKRYLRDIRTYRASVEGLRNHLASVGNNANPLCLTRAQALRDGLDLAISTESQSAAIDFYQLMENAWPALMWQSDESSSVLNDTDRYLEWIYDSFRNCVRDSACAVSDVMIAKYIKAFANDGLFPERDYPSLDNETWVIDRTDVWVCNPAAALEVLKAMEPEAAERFHARSDLDDLYGPLAEDSPTIYKTRYAENRDLIRAKHGELKTWLDSFDIPPPADEISKRDVIELKRESARLGRLIELLENGTSGKSHALFPLLKAYKATLDHLAVTAKIQDIKDVVLARLPFEDEWLKIWRIREGGGNDAAKDAAVTALGLPAFFYDVGAEMKHPNGSWMPGEHLFNIYANRLSGLMPGDLFESAYIWVAKPQTEPNEIAADVFVLFPDQMTDRVKSLPQAERQRVLEYKGNLLDTPAKFFAVFTAAADKHPDYVLSRYQANKAEIDAKFSALIQWHKSQSSGQ